MMTRPRAWPVFAGGGTLARTLGELAAEFGCEIVGDPSVNIIGVATLANAGSNDLSFYANRIYLEDLATTEAGAVIISAADHDQCPVSALLSSDPYLTYAKVAATLHPPPALPAGKHPSAVVAESARVAATAGIAANAVVGEDCVIGDGASVGPGAVVGPGCELGAQTLIHANATLVQDVKIGERCIIHSGAVIGADGFGNARGDAGWVKVPQVGRVIIGNDVEIGANSTVDRGAIDDTVIGHGVRIDNLVQIAHNVRVGDHTAMAAFTGVSGSTTIGRHCMLGGQVGVVGHINICDDVVIAGDSVVSKDIKAPGYYSGTFTAEPDRDWKRKVARLRRLDDLFKRVTSLEKAAESAKADVEND